MAIGSTFANDLLKLLLQATAIANIADNAASSPITNLFIALHTADPSAGDQTTNEVSYTGYARVAVARSSSGWTVSANAGENTAAITFGACTGGSATAAYVSIGKLISGAGEILFSGALSASLSISNGITPQFAINALTVTEN